MAFVSGGSLYGRYNGATIGFAFGTSNLNNPNASQALDILQIQAPGGNVLLQLTNTGKVNVGSAVSSTATENAVLVKIPLVITAYNSLSANPTAAQICQAAFPANYNNQQYDILQISSDTQMNAIEGGGGGAEVFRLTYNGVGTTN